ncbi:MAG: adenosylmethionine--8-amino-7-oxononanoate transaminase [Candidatus Latescibacteria bacterium]|nr:adenosylmethionine--8-amino-7-oxononanoate transaminase [Candidatus Latescibacterota bacterium]
MTEQQKQHLKDLDHSIVWHPFTQMQDYVKENPLIITKGDGVYLEDIDGNRYMDGYASVWCNVHGHQVPQIDQAIKEQLDQIAHSTFLGASNIPAIQLAEKLVTCTPIGLNKVFYSDNGATAVEIALKMAFQYWQQCDKPRPEKNTFLHLTESYHGDTVGSISVGGIALFHQIYSPLLFPTTAVPVPHPYRCDHCNGSCNKACFDTLEDTLVKHADTLAAMIIEPLVQGAGGMLMHPQGYLKHAADLCKKHNVLFIVDEVATGFGRTGKMFACDNENVTPDILCLGKGLTGGYLPVAATLTTNEIYDAFLGEYTDMKTFFHGHTYTGNPLGCAAALATLNIFEEEHTLQKLQSKIACVTQRLTRFQNLKHVGNIRQCGFIIAIELVANRQDKTPYPFENRIGHQVCKLAQKNGLLLRPLANTLVLMPPFSITENEIEHMLNILYDAIHTVTESAS